MWIWPPVFKPTIDSSNLSRLRLKTYMGRLNVPKLTDELLYKQPAGFYMLMLLATVIAAINIYCVLPLGEHNGSMGGIPL